MGEDRLSPLHSTLLGEIYSRLDARSRAALWATCRAVPEAEDVSCQVGGEEWGRDGRSTRTCVRACTGVPGEGARTHAHVCVCMNL